MKKRKKVIQLIVIIFILIGCFFYLYTKGTYTSYESSITGDVNPNIAKWNIKINEETISTVEEKTVTLKDIRWTTKHVAEGKVAPGSKGIMTLSIDPTGTDVSIRYDLQIMDKKIDTTKILTVHSVTTSLGSFVQTGENLYTGVLSLEEISKGPIIVQLEVEWMNDDTINDFDTVINSNDDYLTLAFTAAQYRGEAIVPFVK